MVKYKKKRSDPKQLTLVPKKITAEMKTEIKLLKKTFTCPFCLYNDSLHKFQVRIKKGYSKKRFKCPDCGQVMQKKTLCKVMNVKEFANYIVDNIGFGIWKRISFNKFKKRLKDMGHSYEFWEEYKKAKMLLKESQIGEGGLCEICRKKDANMVGWDAVEQEQIWMCEECADKQSAQ